MNVNRKSSLKEQKCLDKVLIKNYYVLTKNRKRGELSILKVKLIKIAVVSLCIPATKVTSHIVSEKINKEVYGDDYGKKRTDKEWIKTDKSYKRSLFLSTLAVYISISVLVLKMLLKSIL